VAELVSVLNDEPSQTTAIDQLMRMYTKQARWQDAEKLLTARMKAEPDNLEWPLQLLSLYQSSKDADKAIRVASEVAQKSRYADNIVDTVLQAYLQFERYDDLIKFVETRLPADKKKRLTIDMTVATAYAGKGDRAKALERYNRVLEATTPSVEMFTNVVAELKKRLGSQTAMEVVQQRLSRKSDERASKFVLGALQKEAGQKDAFVNAIKGLLDTLPKEDTPQIAFEKLYLLQSLALEHYQRGEFPEARKAYEQMIAISPDNVLALNNLAYLLMEHFNDPKSALPYSRQAANTVPYDPNILDTVGWNHVLLGNYDLGIAALRRAIGMDDGLPAVHYHTAEAFFQRGQSAKTGRDADLHEAETEIKRAHELIRAKGADTEGIFDKVLALGEKLGLKLDPKLGPK